ncbi:hypothetical protein LPJ64_005468 [Coemansia asiatica]|uniref:Uncharacterized protein n=1 Tax=Coemansia asiatica TaxID=1052880 RepID=A0A9W7XED5_9FUNG|nr:hypothetical protein LPJ64_005468 [Coemansia asiatica]
MSRQPEQQPEPDYETQATKGVTNLQITQQALSTQHKRQKPAETSESSDAIVSLLGSYGEQPSDSEQQSLDNTEDGGGLPAGFFDNGIEPTHDEKSSGEEQEKEEKDEEMEVEVEKIEEQDDLDSRLRAFESEVSQLETNKLETPLDNNTGDNKPDSADAKDARDAWADRVHRLAELKNQIITQLQAPEPPTNSSDKPDPMPSSEESSSDSDIDLTILTDWRKSGITQ